MIPSINVVIVQFTPTLKITKSCDKNSKRTFLIFATESQQNRHYNSIVGYANADLKNK